MIDSGTFLCHGQPVKCSRSTLPPLLIATRIHSMRTSSSISFCKYSKKALVYAKHADKHQCAFRDDAAVQRNLNRHRTGESSKKYAYAYVHFSLRRVSINNYRFQIHDDDEPPSVSATPEISTGPAPLAKVDLLLHRAHTSQASTKYAGSMLMECTPLLRLSTAKWPRQRS
jgi:hypothetical protein